MQSNHTYSTDTMKLCGNEVTSAKARKSCIFMNINYHATFYNIWKVQANNENDRQKIYFTFQFLEAERGGKIEIKG